MIYHSKNSKLHSIITSFETLKYSQVFGDVGSIRLKISGITDIDIGDMLSVYFDNAKTDYIIDKVNIYEQRMTGLVSEFEGLELKSILDRRVVGAVISVNSSVNIDGLVRSLLNQHVINPSDPKRKIDNVVIHSRAITERTQYSTVFEEKRLGRLLDNILGLVGMSFTVDKINGVYNISFYGSNQLSDKIILSQEFGSIEKAELKKNIRNISNKEASGLDRIETDSKEYKTTTLEILPSISAIDRLYSDFNLGDMVRVEALSVSEIKRVAGITTYYSNGNKQIELMME